MSETTMTNREKAAARSQLRSEEDATARRAEILWAVKPKRTNSGVIWEDRLNERTYRRLMGGAAWPGPTSFVPTCHMAILGEDTEIDHASGRHKIWLLFEESAQSIEEMLAQMCMRMDALVCRDWVLPVEEPEYVRVETWMRERRRRRLPVPQMMAPPVSRFVQLNALMQARTTTTKSFFFGPESVAAATYISVPDADFERSLNKYPQIGAVLYPLGYLDLIERRDGSVGRHIPAEGGY